MNASTRSNKLKRTMDVDVATEWVVSKNFPFFRLIRWIGQIWQNELDAIDGRFHTSTDNSVMDKLADS